jgi:hypothetical protein
MTYAVQAFGAILDAEAHTPGLQDSSPVLSDAERENLRERNPCAASGAK